MIERTFINPATNKQWRIEIDGYTIRTCLNGGRVKEILCDSAFQVKSKAASAMMGQMRKGFVYQNRDAAVGQARCHRFVGKDSNGFMPLAAALTRDDFFLTRVVGDFEDEILYHFDGSGEILETVSLGGKRMTYEQVLCPNDILIALGVDIVCVRSTQNHYFIGDRLFELPELKLLVDAVESSRFITSKKSGDLIRKLGQLTSSAQAEQLDRHIYMDGMPKPSNEAIYYIVDTIQSSIQSNQQISFQYYEYLPTKEKVLKHQGYRYQFTPYALIWNRDHYYVVGWSEKHMKLSQFRVDRMTSVEMMDQPGHQLLGFEPAEYVQKVFGMYPDDLQMVTLFCENDVMRSIIDRFGEGVRTEVVDDDHFQAIVEVAPSPPFFGWIFTFAGKIRILKPDNVLEEMRQMASWL